MYMTIKHSDDNLVRLVRVIQPPVQHELPGNHLKMDRPARSSVI